MEQLPVGRPMADEEREALKEKIRAVTGMQLVSDVCLGVDDERLLLAGREVLVQTRDVVLDFARRLDGFIAKTPSEAPPQSS